MSSTSLSRWQVLIVIDQILFYFSSVQFQALWLVTLCHLVRQFPSISTFCTLRKSRIIIIILIHSMKQGYPCGKVPVIATLHDHDLIAASKPRTSDLLMGHCGEQSCWDCCLFFFGLTVVARVDNSDIFLGTYLPKLPKSAFLVPK